MTVLPSMEIDLCQPVTTVFDSETGHIKVQVDKVAHGYMDRLVRYRGKVFQPKSELHITIISEDADKILKHLSQHPYDASEIEDLIISTNWGYRKLDKFYYVEKEPEVETIIQMVELPDLTLFLQGLSKLIGQGLMLPPTHVTLYTRGTEIGIGLPNQVVFDELVKAPIMPDEVSIDNNEHRPGENDQAHHF